MVRAYDNWERLVRATLLREELRRVARQDSVSSSMASDFDRSFRLDESSLNLANLSISFTHNQIIEATGKFSNNNLIKQGGNYSGDLFRGILVLNTQQKSRLGLGLNSIPVVVKRIDLSLVTEEAYESELCTISKFCNSQSVPFLGHCLDKKTVKFLVYSLAPLDWKARMKIAIRVAKGLKYLHHHCDPPVVHGDVRASCMFLDNYFEEQMESLIQDYTHEGKAHAHPSEFFRKSGRDTSDTPKERCADDVYNFGVILLELVTGNLGFSEYSNSTLNDWLQKILYIIERYGPMLVDPTLQVDDIRYDGIWLVSVIAKTCLHRDPFMRPQMSEILEALENPMHAGEILQALGNRRYAYMSRK